MQSFTFHNPTRIRFGTDALEALPEELAFLGKKILLTYGGGSIRKTGLYDRILALLHQAGKEVHELGGILPNPRKEKVYEGIALCKQYGIDAILAVGGGSVIDASKFIAAGARTDRDFWQAFLIDQEDCLDALPLGTILTLPATGSEMNSGGVISDWDAHIKTSYGHPLLYPRFSILDPSLTLTLPREQMIYGAVDTLSHIFEQYFSLPDDDNLSDDLSEALIKNIMVNLDQALKDPLDLQARSNLMWDSTMALNGLIGLGKEQDWMTHQIEHTLSAFYDIPHGAGLAIVHPNTLLYMIPKAPEKFARFAHRIFGISQDSLTLEEQATEGVLRLRAYFDAIGAPATLQDVGIPAGDLDRLVQATEPYATSYLPDFSPEDVRAILNLCTRHPLRD